MANDEKMENYKVLENKFASNQLLTANDLNDNFTDTSLVTVHILNYLLQRGSDGGNKYKLNKDLAAHSTGIQDFNEIFKNAINKDINKVLTFDFSEIKDDDSLNKITLREGKTGETLTAYLKLNDVANNITLKDGVSIGGNYWNIKSSSDGGETKNYLSINKDLLVNYITEGENNTNTTSTILNISQNNIVVGGSTTVQGKLYVSSFEVTSTSTFNNVITLSKNSGGISSSVDTALYKSDDANSLNITGGTNLNTGAHLILRGQNQSTIEGIFQLCARNGNASSSLDGTPSGVLSWNEHQFLDAYNRATFTNVTSSYDIECDNGDTKYYMLLGNDNSGFTKLKYSTNISFQPSTGTIESNYFNGTALMVRTSDSSNVGNKETDFKFLISQQNDGDKASIYTASPITYNENAHRLYIGPGDNTNRVTFQIDCGVIADTINAKVLSAIDGTVTATTIDGTNTSSKNYNIYCHNVHLTDVYFTISLVIFTTTETSFGNSSSFKIATNLINFLNNKGFTSKENLFLCSGTFYYNNATRSISGIYYNTFDKELHVIYKSTDMDESDVAITTDDGKVNTIKDTYYQIKN